MRIEADPDADRQPVTNLEIDYARRTCPGDDPERTTPRCDPVGSVVAIRPARIPAAGDVASRGSPTQPTVSVSGDKPVDTVVREEATDPIEVDATIGTVG